MLEFNPYIWKAKGRRIGAGAALRSPGPGQCSEEPQSKKAAYVQNLILVIDWRTLWQNMTTVTTISQANALRTSAISKPLVFTGLSSFLKGDAEHHRSTRGTRLCLHHGVVWSQISIQSPAVSMHGGQVWQIGSLYYFILERLCEAFPRPQISCAIHHL